MHLCADDESTLHYLTFFFCQIFPKEFTRLRWRFQNVEPQTLSSFPITIQGIGYDAIPQKLRLLHKSTRSNLLLFFDNTHQSTGSILNIFRLSFLLPLKCRSSIAFLSIFCRYFLADFLDAPPRSPTVQLHLTFYSSSPLYCPYSKCKN